jgi:predicted Rossmann fold flavoprotein
VDYDLVVAGGGAAGYFGAITCAEACPEANVAILEKSARPLGKVKVSGGGRCNVTHACFDPRELVKSYPRGAKQLLGPFHHWAPGDTMGWYDARGVRLKVESDNRVFPVSDDSQTIIDCLESSASSANVKVFKKTELLDVRAAQDGGFQLVLAGGAPILCRHLLLATGGTRNQCGEKIAAQFGHRVEPAAPSLFTFKCKDPRLEGLAGISVQDASVKIGKKLHTQGPVLITHWGLSGPAILKASAWGARELQSSDYRFNVEVNWCGQLTIPAVLEHFQLLRSESPKRSILLDPQLAIPARLWKRLAETSGIQPSDSWPRLTKAQSSTLASNLSQCRFAVEGKSMNKDEFVTCGGVAPDEVNFKTMESRIVPNLHFAGEILDIDGITGGFNFQAAWTTGKLAGEAIAHKIQPL